MQYDTMVHGEHIGRNCMYVGQCPLIMQYRVRVQGDPRECPPRGTDTFKMEIPYVTDS